MDFFTFKNDEAFCEEVPLAKIAELVGTPVYVYSKSTLDHHCRKLAEAFAPYATLPCYAVKANSNLTLLKMIFSHGFGADVVSLGELERAVKAGVDPHKVMYSGVGKAKHEIERALNLDIMAFNVESLAELAMIAALARSSGQSAAISIRVNPNIDAKTNPKIATGLHSTKFGIAENDLPDVLELIKKNKEELRLCGVSCHIGSQILDLTPLKQAAERMVNIAQELIKQGYEIQFIDMGGGVGIKYLEHQNAPDFKEYASVFSRMSCLKGMRLVIEPGRILVGNCGILLTKIILEKKTLQRRFVVVDAAMNDFIRPTLYGAEHEILPVRLGGVAEGSSRASWTQADVVGPICETGDFIGIAKSLPSTEVTRSGELLFVRGCGAYGFSMASNYNSRPRTAEVLVDGNHLITIRKRETLEDLWRLEI